MSAVLAVSANSFAVVGLADVVLRLLVVCVTYFRRCRNASEAVPRLLRELLSFSTIATNVRAFLDDYSRSTFASQDQKILLDFGTILRDCERELDALTIIATTLLYTSVDSWYARLSRCLGYGFSNDAIEKRCTELERLRSNLIFALSVTGRYVGTNVNLYVKLIYCSQNDIAVREALGSTQVAISTTQVDIRELSQASQTGFQDVTTVVKTNHDAMQGGLADINYTIQGVKTTLQTKTHQMREDIVQIGTLSETHHSTVAATLLHMASTAEQSLEKIVVVRQQQEELNRQQHESENRIRECVENTGERLASQLASLAVSLDDDEMILSGVDLEPLAHPLSLMQYEFERSLNSCLKQGVMDLTIAESSWILKEFRGLLASSMIASAHTINSSAPHSGPQYRTTFAADGNRARTSHTSETSAEVIAPSAIMSHNIHNRLEKSHHNHRTIFHTPVGTLVILSDKVKAHSQSKSTSFRFIFSPNPDMSSVGVSANLTSTPNGLHGYTIYRQPRAHRVMRHDAKINTLLVADDVAGIQALFSAGDATPFDYNEKGWSILDYAAWRSAPQAYKFLLEQGAGSDSLYPRSTEVTAMTKFQPEGQSEAAKCFQIWMLVNERRLSSVWGRGGSLLHDLAYFDARWDFGCLPFEEIINTLLDGGEEIDARDETGCTPLLNACYLGCSPTFVELLLRKGANVNALDIGGWSALHQVLYTASRDCERYGRGQCITGREESVAEGNLFVLLRANCSLDVITKDGQSYADFARFEAVKEIWNDSLDLADIPHETSQKVRATVPPFIRLWNPTHISSGIRMKWMLSSV